MATSESEDEKCSVKITNVNTKKIHKLMEIKLL